MRKDQTEQQIVVAVPKGKDVSRSGATRITTTRAGSDQLTLMIASLIISISFSSAGARDRSHPKTAFTRWGGR